MSRFALVALAFLMLGTLALAGPAALAMPVATSDDSGGVVISMPPPPSAPQPAASDAGTGAEVLPVLGDVALARYRGAREAPRPNSGGWHSFGARSWYRPWYGPWHRPWYRPYGYGWGRGPIWGVGGWGVCGGYRISLSPWSYFGYRTWSGAYAWPW